jgi:adenosylmethionine-8-amino-7-oxononanoate aminotransferase
MAPTAGQQERAKENPMSTQLQGSLVAAYETPLEQAALNHVWIHETPWRELAEPGGLHVFEHGEGIYLYDVHGRRFIDALSGLLVVNVGHGRAELAEIAAEQMRKLAYVSSARYTSVPAAQLAERIAALTPGDLERVFFCSGGSEAVETALKIAKQVQVLRGFPKRYKIIARRGGYHGSTFGAMSVSSNRTVTEPLFGPFMPGVVHIPTVDHYRNDFGVEGPEGDLLAARALEQEIRFQGPESVAAFIGEPISTAAGCHVPSPAYWREVRRICDQYGVLLIMDEVINGWGRTGQLFAAEHFGVVPDILTMAKGLSSGYAPIAAAVARGALYADFQQEARRLAHLLTFGGHAVACAVALGNIEILLREGLVENSARMGEHLLAGLRRLVDVHPSAGQARGKGLMCALDLVRDKDGREPWGKDSPFCVRLTQLLAERGMLVRILGDLLLAPPLVVTRAQLDEMLTIVDDSLTDVEREFGLR